MTERNLKKANKGTTTVVVNSQDKSASPMVTKTNGFVKNKKSVLNSTILHLHKLTLVGRTIISGCIKQLQPIAQQQKSQKTLYLFQWMWQACIKICLKRRECTQYAEHKKHSTEIKMHLTKPWHGNEDDFTHQCLRDLFCSVADFGNKIQHSYFTTSHAKGRIR